MIRSIIRFSANNRFLVILITALLFAMGVWSIKQTPVDAIPDLSDTQVIIYSKWDQSPDLVENQVTFPLVTGLLGTPKVKSVRGISDFGFSYVYVIFEDGTDLYWARSRVLEFLSRVIPQLPRGAQVELGPDATSVGWVFQYAIVDKTNRLNPTELRSLQDWNLKFHLQSVPGVAEVAAIGGFVKQFQVQVIPEKLQSFQINFNDVLKAVAESNSERGGRVLESSGSEIMVRSRVLVENTKDIEDALVKYNPQTRSAIRVKDVAHVRLGTEMRRGVADLDGRGESVGGIVVMRQGEDTTRVIERIKHKLEELKASLPEGVEIVTVYDRSDLISRVIETLKKNLIAELLIVSLMILLFLWHIPSALVPIITIPLSVVLAFIPIYLLGQSANVMSLAGIAISIGVLVDGAIVEVENAYRKIQQWEASGKKEDFHKVRLDALLEVGPSVFFSVLVIAVSFLPIFTLVDQEGRLFGPLALTKTLTMLVAAVLAVTLDPAVRMLFARHEKFQTRWPWLNRLANEFFIGTYFSEERHPISKRLFKIYEPAVRWVLKKPLTTLALAVALCLSTIPIYKSIGQEFMPKLFEGSFLYMPTALPGLSAPEAAKIIQKQDAVLLSFPQVERVFGKAGRADTSTDVAPLSMVETTVLLKPKSEWPKVERWYSFLPDFLESPFRHIWPDHISDDELIRQMNEKLQFPGMPNIWTMPIKNRIDMLSTGIRSAVGIKIYGPDLTTLESLGSEVENLIKDVPGARSVVAERAASGFYLDIDFNRETLANFGFTLDEAQSRAMAAIGGVNVSQTLTGRERFPIQVRYAGAHRNQPEDIRRLLLTSPDGAQVQLGQLAKVSLSEGPSMLRTENGQKTSYVFVDVDTSSHDIGSFVEAAKLKTLSALKIPTGYTISWSGQFENMIRVKERLKVVVPLTLFLILLLIYFNTKSWMKTGIIMLAVPFSMIGAFWLMWALGYNHSIASWVGIIALMGLDAETGIFMLMYLDIAFEDRTKSGKMNNLDDLQHSIIEGAVHRIRPKLMTVGTAFIGLIPIMWSIGEGADVMKRIAAPLIGGLFSSFILELLIYPVLFFEWKKKFFTKVKMNR